MIRYAGLIFGLFLMIALMACTPKASKEADFGIAPKDLKSGSEFLSATNRALQSDNFSNPGYLWVEQGRDLIAQNGCITCHKNPKLDFTMTSAQYPLIHRRTQKLTDLQGQINLCRGDYLNLPAYPLDGSEMLGLVSYIKNQSQGSPLNYEITPDLQPFFEAGKSYYHQRRGQFNLSCAQCHDEHWGKKMRGDTVSQGHINGFPTFRNEWQTLGSAHQRFQACNRGIRAKASKLGSAEYLALEVYLKARGNGLKNETPSIRR